MHTLHHAAEIRSIDAVEELNSVPAKVKPEEMKLAQQVIETFEGPLNLADYKDEYREGLQRIIDAKIAGEEIVAPERRGAAEGRQPDGGAEEEPRRGQRQQEEAGQGRRAEKPAARRRASKARLAESSHSAFGLMCSADCVHAVRRRRQPRPSTPAAGAASPKPSRCASPSRSDVTSMTVGASFAS